MSDTQTRLDAVKLAEWREHVRLLRNEPSIHMNHDDLLMFIDELERVTAALRERDEAIEAFNVQCRRLDAIEAIVTGDAESFDLAALAGGARAAQEGER
jgi:hypothetical protein